MPQTGAQQQISAPSSGGYKSTLSVLAVWVPSECLLLGSQVTPFCSVLRLDTTEAAAAAAAAQGFSCVRVYLCPSLLFL